MKQLRLPNVLCIASLIVSVICITESTLAQAPEIDFGDELKAIGAGNSTQGAKAAQPAQGAAIDAEPSVDFSSELKTISEQQPKSASDDWADDINNFKQGVVSIKEQKRLDEIESIRSKCARFWVSSAAQTCRLASFPGHPLVLTCANCIKEKCGRFAGKAYTSCKKSLKRAWAENRRRKEERIEKAFREEAREEQRQCRKQRSYCEAAKDDIAQGVLPRTKYPSWSASDQRAAILASESLDDVIEPNFDEAIALQKGLDRESSNNAAAIRAAKTEKKRLIELKKAENERATELMCRADIAKHGLSTRCECGKYLPNGGAEMTGCTK